MDSEEVLVQTGDDSPSRVCPLRIQGAKQVPSSKWMLAMFEKLGWGAMLQTCLIIIKMTANSLKYKPAPNVF